MASRTYIDGDWMDGNVPIIGADSHAIWLGSITFDGARTFEGVTPDLDSHCHRLVKSTKVMNMEPSLSAGEIEEIALEGIKKFSPDSALYIRPMFWADSALDVVIPDPESTKFALTIFEATMPDNTGFSCSLSPYRRPGPETAPTNAKASCHYPNSSRALIEARKRGFQNPVLCDSSGHIAEFATSNIWIVKDGIAITPIPNGSFLNGITRQRLIALMRTDGITVIERTIKPEELETADEIFSTGNYGKVQPVNRYENRKIQPGNIYKRTRELYWAFAHS